MTPPPRGRFRRPFRRRHPDQDAGAPYPAEGGESFERGPREGGAPAEAAPGDWSPSREGPPASDAHPGDAGAPQEHYEGGERRGRYGGARGRFRGRGGRFPRRQRYYSEGGEGPAPEGGEHAAPTEEDIMPTGPTLEMPELQALTVRELAAKVKEQGIEVASGLRKHDLVCALVRHHLQQGGAVHVRGVLEILPDGYGFLRASRYSYVASPEDLYVSASHIRKWGIRRGNLVTGWLRAPRGEREKFFGVGKIESIEDCPPEEHAARKAFDKLTPLFPNRRVLLEGKKGDLSMRVLDLVAPIGFGQRGLIVAPPRTGKTIMLQKIANAIMENNPDAYLIMLLVDERPEEVTDMLRHVKGEVISSTFDESPQRHVQVTEMVMERARRLVEMKRDVIILIDSITRLSRAYNNLRPGGGRIMSGGIDSNALQKPKRFFGSARNVEEGGSLTIIATALVETGSRMDDLIFEEYKGTGNLEITLDRQLAERRMFPAIAIHRSGTRKEELLYHPDELQRINLLRKALAAMMPMEALELLLARLRKTKNNAEFLMGMNM